MFLLYHGYIYTHKSHKYTQTKPNYRTNICSKINCHKFVAASGEVSVRLSPCGWCWVVSGRRIVSWPRTPMTSSTASPAPASTIARELTLPQTDLAHKADLVVVFYEDGAQVSIFIMIYKSTIQHIYLYIM